jgi:hypothetical protein
MPQFLYNCRYSLLEGSSRNAFSVTDILMQLACWLVKRDWENWEWSMVCLLEEEWEGRREHFS